MTAAAKYDLVIIGGGLVGGTLACALKGAGLRVCLVEAVAAATHGGAAYDERVIAMSWGSRLILQGAGLWPRIEPEAEPIRRVHVSDRGHFGFARLDHREEGVAALGYVAPARAIGGAIQRGLDGVDLLCPARPVGFRIQADRVDLEVASAGESRLLSTSLLVAADGGDSAIRRRLGFAAVERRYGHTAIISTVTPDRPLPGTAFERFTDTGPLAMLPMTEGRYSVVWTAREEETADILGLSDEGFLHRLQGRFGYRLGGLSRPGRRFAYPLRLMLTRDPVRSRVVLVGNAAHTLHPVAGQGFNLGLRDVAALAQVAADSVRTDRDPGGKVALDTYRRLRGRDQAAVGAATDLLARLFVNPWLPLRMSRDLGMVGLDLLPGLRHLFARRFMGLSPGMPRLARGLPV
jgi:2-octaprenyl-6-methoxyphenol hydroxylase